MAGILYHPPICIMKIKKITTLLLSSSLLSIVFTPVYAENYEEIGGYEELTTNVNNTVKNIDDKNEDDENSSVHCCRCGCCLPDVEEEEVIEEEIFCDDCKLELTKNEMENNARELASVLPSYQELKKDNRFSHLNPISREDLESGDIMVLSDVMYIYVHLEDEIYTWYEVHNGVITEELPNLRFSSYGDFYRINTVKPAYIKPDGLVAVQGSILSSIKLPKGYEWHEEDKETELSTVGENVFYIDYTPENLLMYGKVLNIKVIVNVIKPSMSLEYPQDRYTISYHPGLTLSNIILPSGWYFENSEQLLDIGSGYYTALFDANEDYDYIQSTEPVEIKITVEKATMFVDDIYLTIDKGTILTDDILPVMNNGTLEWDSSQNVVTTNNIYTCHFIPHDLSRYLVVKNIPVHITVKENESSEDIVPTEPLNPENPTDIPDSSENPDTSDTNDDDSGNVDISDDSNGSTTITPEIPSEEPVVPSEPLNPSESGNNTDSDTNPPNEDNNNNNPEVDKDDNTNSNTDIDNDKNQNNTDIGNNKEENNEGNKNDVSGGDVIIDSSTGDVIPSIPDETPSPSPLPSNEPVENFEIISSENQDITAKVIVLYKDGNGNEISTRKIITGKVGDRYSVREKSIDGYKVYKSSANTEGLMSKNDTVVTFIYNNYAEQFEELKITSLVSASQPVVSSSAMSSNVNNTNYTVNNHNTTTVNTTNPSTSTQVVTQVTNRPSFTVASGQINSNKTNSSTVTKPSATQSGAITASSSSNTATKTESSTPTNTTSTTPTTTVVKTPEQLKKEQEEKKTEEEENNKKLPTLSSISLGVSSSSENSGNGEENDSTVTKTDTGEVSGKLNPVSNVSNNTVNAESENTENTSSQNNITVNNAIGINSLVPISNSDEEKEKTDIPVDEEIEWDEAENTDEENTKKEEDDKKESKNDNKKDNSSDKKPIGLIVGISVIIASIFGVAIFLIKRRS